MLEVNETVPSITRKFVLGDEQERLVVYVVVPLRDSKPCGIIIYAGPEGSIEGGLFRLLGHETTWLLERGIPLNDIVKLWSSQAFGPRGIMDRKFCSGPLDAIAAWLKERFGGEDDGNSN